MMMMMLSCQQASMLNADRINRVLHMGGVRIEDNVAITETGAVNLTRVPKARKDLEEIAAMSLSAISIK